MAEENYRHTGVVSMFSAGKGFGFIKPDDGSDDLFVHFSDIRSEKTRSDGSSTFRTLRKGQTVEFLVNMKGGRTCAADVSGLGGANVERDGGAGDGQRNGGECFKCGNFGHKAVNCTAGASNGGCYTCGDVSHKSRECPARAANVQCYGCNKFGHIEKNCLAGGGSGRVGGGGGCYNCHEIGHLARECPNENVGGSSGRVGGGGGCYNCHEFGHVARECPNGNVGGGSGRVSRGSGKCYSCDNVGHLARDCPNNNERSSGQGRGGRYHSRGVQEGCYNCGDLGHFARDCQSPTKALSSI